MLSKISVIQEVTVQAVEFKIFRYMFFDLNMDRESCFKKFEDWGIEFYNRFGKHWDKAELQQTDSQGMSYYDMIDEFVMNKFEELKKEHI